MNRIDKELVARGLVESRTKAQRLLADGLVRLNGSVVTSPDRKVGTADALEVCGTLTYVGRGGEKIEAALRHFQPMVQGAHCLDVGSSTGGFTDCLLQNGAHRVVCVDVGTGQLHPKLRAHPAVEVREQTDVRKIDEPGWRGYFQIVVVDVSFISLRLVLPAVLPWVSEDGWLIALVKPQFETGPSGPGKGGILKDAARRDQIVASLRAWIDQQRGWRMEGIIDSPLTGGDGNVEFLLCARPFAR